LPFQFAESRAASQAPRPERSSAMSNRMTLTERGLGYLGLVLIGALSWAADHAAPSDRRAPTARPRVAPPRPFRPGVSVPVIQRTNG